MTKVEVIIRGTTPLMQNRFDTAFELEKKLKLQRKSIDKLPTVEQRLYKNGKGVYVPSEWIEGTLKNASKGFKMKGNRTYMKAMAGMVEVTPEEIIIKPQEWVTDVRSAVNHNMRQARIIVQRPRFNKWALAFTLNIDDDLEPDKVKEILIEAGKTEGIGSYRPNCGGKFGKFEVVKYDVGYCEVE